MTRRAAVDSIAPGGREGPSDRFATTPRTEIGGSLADGPRPPADPAGGRPGAPALTKPAWSAELPSIESVVIDGRRRIVYAGPSMNPTLREPDLLWVEPYGNRSVRVGDVVCYWSSEEKVNIVHRVISVGHRSRGSGRLLKAGPKDGIRTRGDNNLWPDAGVIATEDLLGQVVSAQRGSRLRPIPGGWTGRTVAWRVRLGKAVWRTVVHVVSGAYQRLARGGPFDFVLPRDLKPRPVRFSGQKTTSFKLLMGSRTIGHYNHRYNRWCIRRPFRLFVDEQSLPDPRSKARDPRSE
jgi:signal peptidase